MRVEQESAMAAFLGSWSETVTEERFALLMTKGQAFGNPWCWRGPTEDASRARAGKGCGQSGADAVVRVALRYPLLAGKRVSTLWTVPTIS